MTVLVGVLGLGWGLYGLIGYIVIEDGADAVPDALWLAAGTYGGALVTWLVNSKGGDSQPAGTTSDPVNVKTAEEPLEVTSVETASTGTNPVVSINDDAPASSDL